MSTRHLNQVQEVRSGSFSEAVACNRDAGLLQHEVAESPTNFGFSEMSLDGPVETAIEANHPVS
jgi:hypothetical protein